jgi:hypothetical protein
LIRPWEVFGSPNGGGLPADGELHEQAPVTLVAGRRTGTFAPVHDQRPILVAHPPLPTTAAFGYSHFHHGGKTPNVLDYFKAETVSLRSMQKGSLTPNHRRHRTLS